MESDNHSQPAVMSPETASPSFCSLVEVVVGSPPRQEGDLSSVPITSVASSLKENTAKNGSSYADDDRNTVFGRLIKDWNEAYWSSSSNHSSHSSSKKSLSFEEGTWFVSRQDPYYADRKEFFYEVRHRMIKSEKKKKAKAEKMGQSYVPPDPPDWSMYD